MGRVLSDSERAAFLLRHPDVAAEVALIEAGGAHPRSSPLAYPRHGRAYLDLEKYVLVWRDFSGRWWYIDLADHAASLPQEINKPVYVSPGASLLQNVIDETAAMFAAGLKALSAGSAMLPWVVGLVGLLLVSQYLPRRGGA